MSEELPPEAPAIEIDESLPPVPKNVHFGERYLRNRPFLVVNTMAQVRPGVSTHVKGWGDIETNWNIAEQATIVDRVSDKMLKESTFIIDIINNKVVKNRYSETATEDTVLKHFIPKYGQEITEALGRWGAQHKPVPKATIIGNIEDVVKDAE